MKDLWQLLKINAEMLKYSQLCVQWFYREECVFVCGSCWCSCFLQLFLPSTHLLPEGEKCQRLGHTPAWPFASTSSLPHFCIADAHRVTLWLKCLWWTMMLPPHMTEHCSAAPDPGPPARLSDSMSKLKPGGCRERGRYCHLSIASMITHHLPTTI